MVRRSLRIETVEHDFHENFLDLVGKDFSSDHVKGLAEWLKNSSDAYTREDIPDAQQYTYLILDSKPYRFACLDFVGMNRSDIENAFKRWGDPDAAARGKTDKAIWGGHGNGGKFYMRQMFHNAFFITYRGGLLNVFGFDKGKRYGYAKGFENLKMPAKEALEYAHVGDYDLDAFIKTRLKSGDVRFTLVIGENPEKMRGKNGPTYIWRRLTRHPQARRILATKQVFAIVDGGAPFRLMPPIIAPKPGFEKPFEYEIPTKLEWNGETVELASPRFKQGRLILRTAEDPFSRYSESHAIDFFGNHTCVATYRMGELGPFRYQTEIEFLYGECHLPILESKTAGCVRNDRQKLVANEITEALLDWIRKTVDTAAATLETTVAGERRTKTLEQSAQFNEYLNLWQKGFMSKFWVEIFGGVEGGGGDREGRHDSGHKEGNGADVSNAESSAKPTSAAAAESHRRELGGVGNVPQRAPKYPQVLLSGFHPDPGNTAGETLLLNPRHPPIYQRPKDQQNGIYWINTESPFAKAIQEMYGANSTRWREYLFLRRMDIIIKQTIYQRARQEPKLTADIVDLTIDDVQRRVFEVATRDLKSYLFEPPTRIAPIEGANDSTTGGIE